MYQAEIFVWLGYVINDIQDCRWKERMQDS
jgi:hypothetical protein